MSNAFDSHAFAEQVQTLGASFQWRAYALPSVDGFARPWFQRGADHGLLPRLYISAGIHGDEPAGCWAAAAALQHPEWFDGCAVTLFPILNPVGQARGVRENGHGVDLNRDYRYARSMEVATHIAALEQLPPFDFHLHLHEDWESAGAYLYALHSPTVTGGASVLLAAMGKHTPIDVASLIDGHDSRDGVIRRDELPEMEDWPEPFYFAHRHGAYHGYTLEAPSSFPLEQRVAALAEGVRALAEFACRRSS